MTSKEALTYLYKQIIACFGDITEQDKKAFRLIKNDLKVLKILKKKLVLTETKKGLFDTDEDKLLKEWLKND